MIHIKKLCKSFNSKKVLVDLDLEINDGEILVILGKSGSGKSVLLKHVIGLIKPDSGEVYIDEQNMTELEGPKLYEALVNVGMIFQGCALFDSMTVGENTAFHLKEHQKHAGEKIFKSDMKQIVSECLTKVGLAGTEHLYPSDLSGGMKKRAAIARCLAFKPRYTFYDEPTTGLDPVTAKTIGKLMKETHEELKGTTVIVSHDIPTTLSIADRIALIEDGRITVIAKPHEFILSNHPTIVYFRETIQFNLDEIGS